jgi:hypothetical protein
MNKHRCIILPFHWSVCHLLVNILTISFLEPVSKHTPPPPSTQKFLRKSMDARGVGILSRNKLVQAYYKNHPDFPSRSYWLEHYFSLQKHNLKMLKGSLERLLHRFLHIPRSYPIANTKLVCRQASKFRIHPNIKYI